MKYFKTVLFVLAALVAFSCEDDEKQRREATLRAEKQNDSILKIISNNWQFKVAPATPKVQVRITTWNEWQQFRNELSQKPTGSLRAYRQKTKNLVNRADQLKNNIPLMFDKPQVRSRLGVLITKIKSLYTYLNLEVIQEKKVLELLGEVTRETESVQNQLDEIIRISEIPREVGEEEMLRALDTTRMANPDRAPQPEMIQPQPDPTMERTRLQERINNTPPPPGFKKEKKLQ